ALVPLATTTPTPLPPMPLPPPRRPQRSQSTAVVLDPRNKIDIRMTRTSKVLVSGGGGGI
ncbi:MAG: hypothetical protein ACOC9R_03180, partial [bacterium]